MKYPSHQVKMMVLGAIEFAEGKTRRDRFKKVAETTFHDEQGRPCRFTWRTIETWFTRFQKHGITLPCPKPRSDKGKRRKMQPEKVQEAVNQVLPRFREGKAAKMQIYRACLEEGLLRRDRIAPNTFCRMLNEYEMLKPESEVENKKRLAFSKKYANDMWQADTMYGPYVRLDGKPIQTRLICFIDDASRLVPHGEFFFHENADTLISVVRSAFYKRGLPKQIYVDNGSIYTSKEIITICARLGILLSHAPVRDGSAKGKIEKYFRYVRGEFLSRNLDLSSLEALNRQFNTWVEEEYNTRPHSVIQMRPVDRFGLDLPRIRFLPPNQVTDELFYIEESRKVKKDNTFSFQNTRFEAPADMRKKIIQVRFDRKRKDNIIIYYKEERIGPARLLRPTQNDRAPRPITSLAPSTHKGDQ